MKKLVLSLGVLVLGTQISLAQHAKVETGVKVGLNMANFSGAQPQEFKPGAHVSGFIEMPFSYYKQFSMTLELMYSMQGYTGTEYQQFDDVTFAPKENLKLGNVTTHNIYVPISFNYYVNKNFAINVGARIGYMFDANGEFDINKVNPARQYLNYADDRLNEYLFEQGYRSNDFRDYYESLDFGVHAGFTFDVSKNVFVSARYYLGLKDIYSKDNDYKKLSPPDNSEGLIPEDMYNQLVTRLNFYNKHLSFDPITNSVIQVSLGYRF